MNIRLGYLSALLPCMLVAIVGMSGPLRGDEVVIRPARSGGVRGGNGARGENRVQRRQGVVLEYSGRGLVLGLPDGRRERYSADRIVQVTPSKAAEHAAADRLREQGRFADALTAYRQARRKESRDWVRRLILSREATCYAAEGQIRYAGETFLSIVRSDATTPYFGAIPLPWSRSRAEGDLEQAAAEWIGQQDLPAARLLGAGWLLGTPQRSAALESLRQLATDSDPRIALLAEAQLWRSQYVTASPDDVRRWSQRVESMPPAIRPGPYYVVGLAFARHQQYQDAALAWLRVPILYPDHYRLAAASLWQAAAALQQAGPDKQAGRDKQAVGLLREIVSRYPASEYVGGARERIEEIEKGDVRASGR